MSPQPIDIIFFTIFLTANLILGIQAGFRVNSFREYAVGSKDFSTGVLTATILATWINGGTLFYSLSNIYTSGLRFIIVFTGPVICLLLIGQVLAIRMYNLLDNLSVAETMGNLYGTTARVITGISGILGRIGHLAVQFQIMAQMLALISGLQGAKVTVIAATVVIIYSAFGGVRAVTMTDMLQFFTFSMFIPLLALIAWDNLRDPKQVSNLLATEPMFSFRETVSWNSKFISSLYVLFVFAFPSLNPTIFQRIVMARDFRQVRRAFTQAAGINLLINMTIAWMAILLVASSTELDPNNLIPHIINRYAYVGLKGLVAVGITAMAMSTADSDLNSFSVLAVHDILKPIFPSFKESIKAARVCSVLIGILGLLLAMREGDILKLLLLTASFYMPIVSVPLLMAIFGFRSTPRAALTGMTAGTITVLIWHQYLTHLDLPAVIPGILANLVSLLGSHYLLGEEDGETAQEKSDKKEEAHGERYLGR